MKFHRLKITTNTKALKRITFLLLIICLPLISGCDVEEIPEDDDTPPGFLFSISGPGGSNSFNQEDDFENLQLNIKAEGSYDFSLLGTDAGGVKEVTFQFGAYDDFEVYEIEPSEVTNETAGLSRFLTLAGDAENAKTGLSLSGGMEVLLFDGNETKSADFHFSVIDFNDNTIKSRLTILIVTDDDELGLIEL